VKSPLKINANGQCSENTMKNHQLTRNWQRRQSQAKLLIVNEDTTIQSAINLTDIQIIAKNY